MPATLQKTFRVGFGFDRKETHGPNQISRKELEVVRAPTCFDGSSAIVTFFWMVSENVTFWKGWLSDLQRLGMKRSRIESPGFDVFDDCKVSFPWQDFPMKSLMFTLSPIIMVQWKITLNERIRILEIHSFSTEP